MAIKAGDVQQLGQTVWQPEFQATLDEYCVIIVQKATFKQWLTHRIVTITVQGEEEYYRECGRKCTRVWATDEEGNRWCTADGIRLNRDSQESYDKIWWKVTGNDVGYSRQACEVQALLSGYGIEIPTQLGSLQAQLNYAAQMYSK